MAETGKRELRGIAAWSMGAAQIEQHACAILETMPDTLDDLCNRQARRTWIASARLERWRARDGHCGARNYAALPTPPTLSIFEDLTASF